MNLHPTMYLLIHTRIRLKQAIEIFTSHYVSINSKHPLESEQSQLYLHPTMYLLIPLLLYSCYPNFRNLHPTMYLLIHSSSTYLNHNQLHLHPTMYLLIRI